MKTETQTQHTQGEWDVNDLNEIYSEWDTHIATVHTNKTKEEANANAQRIVKAVNMYDRLIDTINGLLKYKGTIGDYRRKAIKLLKQAEQN